MKERKANRSLRVCNILKSLRRTVAWESGGAVLSAYRRKGSGLGVLGNMLCSERYGVHLHLLLMRTAGRQSLCMSVNSAHGNIHNVFSHNRQSPRRE